MSERGGKREREKQRQIQRPASLANRAIVMIFINE